MEEKERDQFFKQLLDHHPVRGPVDGVVFFEPLKVMLDVVHLVLTITSILLKISAWSLRNPEDQLSQVFSFFGNMLSAELKTLFSRTTIFKQIQADPASFSDKKRWTIRSATWPCLKMARKLWTWRSRAWPARSWLGKNWRYGSLVCFLQIATLW